MSRFSRFPAHVERHLGQVRGAHGRATDQRERAYELVHCEHADQQHVSILSSGLRDRSCGAPLPQEVVCTVRGEHHRHARHLVGTIAELLAESDSRVGYGALIVNDRLLLPETRIAGALAAPHPYLDAEFDVVLDEDDAPALQLITLIPVGRGEAQFAARSGQEALYDRWERAALDLRDVRRPVVA